MTFFPRPFTPPPPATTTLESSLVGVRAKSRYVSTRPLKKHVVQGGGDNQKMRPCSPSSPSRLVSRPVSRSVAHGKMLCVSSRRPDFPSCFCRPSLTSVKGVSERLGPWRPVLSPNSKSMSPGLPAQLAPRIAPFSVLCHDRRAPGTLSSRFIALSPPHFLPFFLSVLRCPGRPHTPTPARHSRKPAVLFPAPSPLRLSIWGEGGLASP